MTDRPDKLEDFAQLVAELAPLEGLNTTRIPGLQLYRESKPHVATPRLYDPYIVFVVQGRKRVAVDELAGLVNMSSSAFHKKYKEVMHLPPLQYAKRVKLNKAQSCILTGMSVSKAGYTVGYNSPAQFSREYKRYFGVTPSEAIQ